MCPRYVSTLLLLKLLPGNLLKKKRNVPSASSSNCGLPSFTTLIPSFPRLLVHLPHQFGPWTESQKKNRQVGISMDTSQRSPKNGDPCFLPPGKAKAWTFRENLENPLASGCVEKEASDRLPGRWWIAGEVPSGAEKDINVDRIWVECMTNLNTWWTTIKCSLKNTSLAKHCQYARSSWHFYNGRVNVLSS